MPRGVAVLVGLFRALYDGLAGSTFAATYLLAEYRHRRRRRSWEYWASMLMLIIGAIGIVGTWYGVLTSAPSAAEVRFETGVVEGAGAGGARSFATPKVQEVLHLRLQLTPAHQELEQIAISIEPPRSVELTSGCFYEVTGIKGKRSCLEPSGEGRVDVGHLASGHTLKITADAQVVRPVEDEETIVITMSSADTDGSSQKQIDLYSPRGTRSEEAAKKYIRENLEGPLRWVESSLLLRDDVFEVLGDEWPFLDPRRLHGFDQIPYGRVVRVRSLVNNRLLGPRIVTFRSSVRSAPVRVRTFRAGPQQVRMFEEVLVVGSKAGGRNLWCTTTRSAAQPHLRPGDHVLVRAALVGWGLARPYGKVVQAAMLICPAIHIADPQDGGARASASGGTAAPR